MQRALISSCLCLLTTIGAAATLPIANDALLHSARLWEARERGDLALLALQKLVAARPDSPEALQELGELALRMDDMTVATQALRQLEARFAGSPAAVAFATAYRLSTRDRLQLASLQRLIELNRTSEARQELQRLFPDGAPRGYLSLQYYQLLARLPGNWQRVRDGLQTLATQHPDQPRYQLALAKHLMREPDQVTAGLQLLQNLLQRDDIRRSEVDAVLISALLDLGPEQAPLSLLSDYVARNPDDHEARKLLDQTRRWLADNQRWWQAWLGFMEPSLANATAATHQQRVDVWQHGSELPQRIAQQLFQLERHTPGLTGPGAINAPAAPHRNDSIAQALDYWRGQVRLMLRQQQLANAQFAMRMATAIGERRFEDLIALLDDSAMSEASATTNTTMGTEVLLAASRWQPASSWLFETAMRRLIRIEPDTAVQWLTQRVPDARFTRSKRDELLALAWQSRADRAWQQHQVSDAIHAWQTALSLSPDDVWLRYRLANALFEAQPAAADAVMQAGLTRRPADPTMRYAAALYFSQTQRLSTAQQLMDDIPVAQRDADLTALAERLQRNQLQQQVDAQIAQGNLPQAIQLLDQLIATSTDKRGLRVWQAQLWLRLDQSQRARELLSTLVAEAPDDLDTRLVYARALIDSGEFTLARWQLQTVRERAAPNHITQQLALAEGYWSLDDARTTADILRPLIVQLPLDKRPLDKKPLAEQPDNLDAWLLAARSELALRQYSRAADLLRQIDSVTAAVTTHDSSPDDSMTHDSSAQTESIHHAAQALLATLAARQQREWSVALSTRDKSGDPGISEFRSRTLASALRWPLGFTQSLTLRADVVQLDAGMPDSNTVNQLGSSYLNGHAHGDSGRQTGLALGLIHQTDSTRVDVGTTPLGFVLPRLVGGIAWQSTWQQLDISVGIERRAVTSSVLSYAGRIDPGTGEPFGGVTAFGPFIQVGRYTDRFSYAGALRWATLTGTQVKDNQQWLLRVAADRRWWQYGAHELWLGATGNVWRYADNLQNATLGQGGYYSPQSYLSLTLPVIMQGTPGRWRYQTRLALTYSQSRTDRSDWFAGHSALQLAAITAAAANDDDPVYAASRGSGFSYSFSARIERRIAEQWLLGGELSLDRADYYRPVEMTLYLRHRFGTGQWQFAPITWPGSTPTPLRPYND